MFREHLTNREEYNKYMAKLEKQRIEREKDRNPVYNDLLNTRLDVWNQSYVKDRRKNTARLELLIKEVMNCTWSDELKKRCLEEIEKWR